VSLTGGHRHDVTQLVPLIDAVRPIRGRVGRPRKRPVQVLGDRAYDHDKYRRRVRRRGIRPLIARRRTAHGSGLGRQRWVVERAFAHLHWFRRLRIRWDRHPAMHTAFLLLAGATSAGDASGHCETGSKRYPADFRRGVLDLVASGRSVTEVARDVGISNQTIYAWRRQEAVHAGLIAGPTSAELAELVAARRRIRELETELAELVAARRRIRELETELAVARRAMELLREGVRPKGASR